MPVELAAAGFLGGRRMRRMLALVVLLHLGLTGPVAAADKVKVGILELTIGPG